MHPEDFFARELGQLASCASVHLPTTAILVGPFEDQAFSIGLLPNKRFLDGLLWTEV